MDANLARSLGQIEGQLKEIKNMLSNDRERLNDHGKRLGSIERKLAAVWVFFGLMLSASGAMAVKVFKGWS